MNRKLKARIIEKFGSQANFSVVIKKTEPEISRIIHGRLALDATEKMKWAKALNKTVAELFDANH